MNKMLLFFLLLLIAASATLRCTLWQEPEISEEEVDRVLKTLSSDEMKGRYAFSPEIEKAADFIASEFNDIGLKPLPELGDFRQSFTIYSLSVDSAFITINGESLSDNDFFALMDSDSIHWMEGEVPVYSITSDDKFRDSFDKFRHDDRHSIVLINPSHSERFHLYRRYFSRPQRKFKTGTGYNDLFVLHSGSVDNIDAFLKSKIVESELHNIVGMIEGNRKEEIVLFSAHYDHKGIIRSVEGDSIGNGANDNASGTTAVIELARYFNKMPRPERTLYFVAFTAEEVGGYGAKYFSRQVSPDNIVAMLNFEMIGKSAIENPNSAWITGFDRSTFGELLQKQSDDSVFLFYPDPYVNRNLFYRSDNISFARKGIPAHTISTTPIEMDNDYHTATDEYSTLSIPHITKTIQAIAIAAQGIVSGDDTPSRIDTTQLK